MYFGGECLIRYLSPWRYTFMEISQYLDFDFLIRFLEGLQKFLGENSEILIHDYRKGYDHTIVYALNAALSGRDVGGSPKGGMITHNL